MGFGVKFRAYSALGLGVMVFAHSQNGRHAFGSGFNVAG